MDETKEYYCAFEAAKLLSEKGLYMPFDMYVNKDNVFMTDHYACLTMDDYADRFHDEFIRTCTHQMARRWLREKGVDISILPVINLVPQKPKYYIYEIRYRDKGVRDAKFDTYEDAEEAALLNVLKNIELI